MKIKEVRIKGMHKVADSTYRFNDDVSYLVGPNGAGKSTVLEAVQLGLLGYIPGYAKTNESILKHSSGNSMEISLVLDSDITITRTWVRMGSSVKGNVEVSGFDAKEINKLIADVELPVFNFNEFRTMTSNKLKEWFIAFLPKTAEGLDLELELRKSVADRSLPVDHLISDLNNRANQSNLQGLDLVKQINAWVKEDQSFIKGQIAKLQATIESLVRYDDLVVEDEEATQLEIEQLSSLMYDLAKYESASNVYQRSLESVNELKESLPADCFANDPRIPDMEVKAVALRKECEDSQKAILEFQQKKAELQSQRESLKVDYAKKTAIKGDTCPYTRTRCDKIAGLISDASREANEIQNKINDIDKKIAEINSRVQTLGLANWTAKESERQQILANVEFIRGQYSKLDALECQLVDPGSAPTDKSSSEIRERIDALNDLLVKIRANKQFDALSDKITADKFAKENDLEVLKTWEKLTGANGLQTELMDKPFKDLACEMSTYLSSMFGRSVEAKFNLSTKANSFSFGLLVDKSYIEFDYLSSGEKCLFTLALTMCILDKSNSQVRTILIDDILDHLDESNASHLFESLKKVDDIQFILAGVKECSDSSICIPVYHKLERRQQL